MNLSAAETERLSRKIAEKMEVRCTTFEFCKTIELHYNGASEVVYGSLADAKKRAINIMKQMPEAKVKVVEVKKKVHEFHVKR